MMELTTASLSPFPGANPRDAALPSAIAMADPTGLGGSNVSRVSELNPNLEHRFCAMRCC